MTPTQRKEVVATLIRSGRRDLAGQFVGAANLKQMLSAVETLLSGVSTIRGPQGKRLKTLVSDVRSTLEMLDAKGKL